jgi:hypothetical protein
MHCLISQDPENPGVYHASVVVDPNPLENDEDLGLLSLTTLWGGSRYEALTALLAELEKRQWKVERGVLKLGS